LDDTYERIFLNIDEESAADAKRILTLLCTARRPLSVAELIDGIAVELGEDPQFNKDSRLMSADDIRHICPGLVEIGLGTYITPPSINIDIYDEVHEAKEVDEDYNPVTVRIVHDLDDDDDDDDDEIHEEDETDEENEVGQDYNTATVRIAHYPVQEYLESDRIRLSRAENFSIEHAEANIDVACICLVYLMNPVLWSFVHSPLGAPTFRKRLVRKYPFAF
jgi:phosphoribosylformylglycinamidine (FGAM) synthase PurS component